MYCSVPTFIVAERYEREKQELEKHILELKAKLTHNTAMSEVEELKRRIEHKDKEKAQLVLQIEVSFLCESFPICLRYVINQIRVELLTVMLYWVYSMNKFERWSELAEVFLSCLFNKPKNLLLHMNSWFVLFAFFLCSNKRWSDFYLLLVWIVVHGITSIILISIKLKYRVLWDSEVH